MKIYFAAALVAIFSSAAQAFPVSVQSCGRTVEFDSPPNRAVSSDVNLTETMLALGLADRMAGYTRISDTRKVAPEYLADLRGIESLSPGYPTKEILLGAGADFLFAGWNYGLKVGGEVTPETLEPLGIKVYELTESCIHIGGKPKASIDDFFNDVRNLGTIFGIGDRAGGLIDQYRSEMNSIREMLPPKDAPLRVFVYDSGEISPFTAGRYAMPTALIEAAGGMNVMDDVEKSWATVSWEEVVARNPQIIAIVNYGSVTAEEKKRYILSNPAFSNVDAVLNDRFVILEYGDATPGPRNFGAIRKLAEEFWQRGRPAQTLQ